MTKFISIVLAVFLVAGCATSPLKPFDSRKNQISVSSNPSKMKARITFYNRFEDKFGSKVAMSPKIRAREGVTVAAHPNFKFNTLVYIPELKGILGDGKFVVQDRGSAVTRRKASNGTSYVFDVYVNRGRRATTKLANKLPPYMDVYVMNPFLDKFNIN